MAVPPPYADLGKAARDIFTKGYGKYYQMKLLFSITFIQTKFLSVEDIKGLYNMHQECLLQSALLCFFEKKDIADGDTLTFISFVHDFSGRFLLFWSEIYIDSFIYKWLVS